MKKGFFLLEALLACVLISLLVGSIMHYHAQWSLCHKKSLDRSKALAQLMTFIEQRAEQLSAKSDGYEITQKKVSVPAPMSSDGDQYPPAQCTEITISWNTGAMSIVGGYNAS
jgi:Tfp pilus assembly protein PilV